MKCRFVLSPVPIGIVALIFLLAVGCRDGRSPASIMPATAVTNPPTPVPQNGAAESEASAPDSPSPLPAGILYHDDFTDITSGWDQEKVFDNYFIGYHEPEFYHVEVGASDDRAIVALPNHKFDDFIVETAVSVSIDNSDTAGDFVYGLAVRRAGNLYYAFVISPRTQTWQVRKSGPAGYTVLDEGKDDSILGLVQNDFLRVDADGPNMTFYINDQIVTQLPDPDYANGEIALYAETNDSSKAHIHFDAITVRELPGSLAGAENLEEASAAFYHDDFTDITSGWDHEKVFDNYFIGYHEPEFYHVEVGASDDRAIVALPNHKFDDFTVETAVSVSIDNSDTAGDFVYGLALRRAGNFYYAFVISPRTQTWEVRKNEPSGYTVLDEGKDNSILGFVQNDILRVDAAGPNMTFYINDQIVTQLPAPDYASGEIALYTETSDSTQAHIHYDSLTVRPVELPASQDPIQPTLPPPTPLPTKPPVPEGMVLIPAGTFRMGSSTGAYNESPEHEVHLSAYYIDQYEVTNAQFRECVAAGGCSQASHLNSATRSGYRDYAEYNNFPVIGVTWAQAVAYCAWAGKRLPTEAEWEYAASGPENFIWPWGNEFDPQLSAASAPDTQPVTSFSEGASPFGVLNMAGNVAEWVQDVYLENFYANSLEENPIGTGNGTLRIYRGGSFASQDSSVFTTSRRFVKEATFFDVDVGFRCAQDAPAEN